MTPQERRDPSIIDGSRRARIAYGAGTTVSAVNGLLQRFEQAAKMMKRMTNGSRSIPGMGGMGAGSGKKGKKGKKGRKGSRSGNPMKREAEEKALRERLSGKGKSSGGSAFAKRPETPQMPEGLPDLPPNLGGGLGGLFGGR